MCYTEKRQESLVQGYNHEFLPQIFLNLGHLEYHAPLNDMWF